jgi:hypothetical protein
VLLWIYCSSKISRQKMSSVVHGQCSVLLLSSSPSSLLHARYYFCVDLGDGLVIAKTRNLPYPNVHRTIPGKT